MYNEWPCFDGTHSKSVLMRLLMDERSSFGSNEASCSLCAEERSLVMLLSGLNNRILSSIPLYAFMPSKHVIP